MGIALAADGRTALIGGHTDDVDKGAAWMFARFGGEWGQQGGKLTASGEVGTAVRRERRALVRRGRRP